MCDGRSHPPRTSLVWMMKVSETGLERRDTHRWRNGAGWGGTSSYGGGGIVEREGERDGGARK